jgi:hypothetical protein
VNIDDKEFILQLLDDYECYVAAHVHSADFIQRTAMARTVLEKNFFKESGEREVDPRQQELQFNDWHQAVYDDNGEDE